MVCAARSIEQFAADSQARHLDGEERGSPFGAADGAASLWSGIPDKPVPAPTAGSRAGGLARRS